MLVWNLYRFSMLFLQFDFLLLVLLFRLLTIEFYIFWLFSLALPSSFKFCYYINIFLQSLYNWRLKSWYCWAHWSFQRSILIFLQRHKKTVDFAQPNGCWMLLLSKTIINLFDRSCIEAFIQWVFINNRKLIHTAFGPALVKLVYDFFLRGTPCFALEAIPRAVFDEWVGDFGDFVGGRQQLNATGVR